MKLEDIPKDVSGFEVPEGFFEQMEKNVLEAIQSDEQQEPSVSQDLSSALEKSKHSFRVPKGYFEETTTPLNSKPTIVINWWRVAVYAAAASVISIGLFLWLKRDTTHTESFAMLLESSDLTEEEIVGDVEEEILYDVYGNELDAMADTFSVDTADTQIKAKPFVPKPGEKVNWDELRDDDFIFFLEEEGFDENDI